MEASIVLLSACIDKLLCGMLITIEGTCLNCHHSMQMRLSVMIINATFVDLVQMMLLFQDVMFVCSVSPFVQANRCNSLVFFQGTMVVQALAKDQDEINDRVQYDLDGEGSQFFAIDEYTGMVTVVDAAGIVRGRQYLLRLEVKHFSFIHHTVKPYHIARQ